MSIHFDTMPHHCTGTVTTAVEAYSPAGGNAHGSLDATAYVCPNHVQTARDLWQTQGLTPYSTQAAKTTNRCGAVTDFRDSDSAVTPA